MVEVSGGQWAKHMLYGTSRIFQLSGAGSRSDYLGSQSFETFRLLEGNRAILYGEDTVLSDYSFSLTKLSQFQKICDKAMWI
uniref:Uncharacterized protein n=1 Tax=Fusarium oxysporum (strain Fo5176) TaxID=660025 RepID=A0A0D2XJ62_FUSOF